MKSLENAKLLIACNMSGRFGAVLTQFHSTALIFPEANFSFDFAC